MLLVTLDQYDKLTQAIAIHKASNHSLLNNYRPGVLQSSISKMYKNQVFGVLVLYCLGEQVGGAQRQLCAKALRSKVHRWYSIVACINLVESEFEPRLPHQKAGTILHFTIIC